MFTSLICCRCYTAGVKVLSSLPLQMLMYFNIYYSPMWALAVVLGLILKVCSKHTANIEVQLIACACASEDRPIHVLTA